MSLTESKIWKIAAITLGVMVVFALQEHPLVGHWKPLELIVGAPFNPVQIPIADHFYMNVLGAGIFAFILSWSGVVKGQDAIWSVVIGALYGYIYLLTGIFGVFIPFLIAAAFVLMHFRPGEPPEIFLRAWFYYELLSFGALGSGFVCGTKAGVLVGAMVSIFLYGIMWCFRRLATQVSGQPAEAVT